MPKLFDFAADLEDQIQHPISMLEQVQGTQTGTGHTNRYRAHTISVDDAIVGEPLYADLGDAEAD